MDKNSNKTKEQLYTELLELREKSKDREKKLNVTIQQQFANNQQLQATEQQLRALEQQLRAANQQLEAHNQQLQATEQQLRAANQQLEASNIEIRKREAEALEAKEYAENIIKTLHEPLLILDNKLKVITANLAFYKTYKISQQDTIGEYIFELGDHQWDIPELKKLLLEILPNHSEINDFEIEHQFKDFDSRTMLLNSKELNQEQGKAKLILLAIEDITERKQAEEALKEKEKFVKTIFDGIQEPMHVIDRDYKVLLTNKKLLEMKNVKQEDIRGKYCYEAYQGRNEHCEQCGTKEVFNTGKPYSLIKSLPLYDGSYSYFEVYSFPLFEESGAVTQVIEMTRDVTERKRAEEKLKAANQQLQANNQQLRAIEQQLRATNQQLRASEDRLSKTMIAANDGMWDWNLTTNEVYFDPRYFEMAGYDVDEFPHRLEEFQKRIHPEDIDYVMNEAQKHIEGKLDRFTVEFRFKKKNSDWMWIKGRGIIVERDDQSNPIRFIGTHTDITDRKQAEEELRKSEVFRTQVFDSSHLPIVVMEADTFRYIDCNTAAMEIYGYTSKEQVIGLSPMDVSAPFQYDGSASSEKAIYYFEKAKKESSVVFEWKHQRPDGTVWDAELHLLSFSVGDRALLQFTLVDITQRKQNEKELTKLSTAVTQSPSVFAITDTEGKLQYVNPKFKEITGYSQEKVIGRNPRILQSGEHPIEMYKELWETISSGKTWRGEFHNKKKNGELFWEMASISPIFDEQGNIINYIKISEDITRQKRNEQIQSVIHHISNAVIIGHKPESFLSLVKEELGKLIDTTNFFVALYNEETDSISLPFHHDEKDSIETFPAGKTMTKYVIKTGNSLLATKALRAKLEKSGEFESIGHPSEVWLGVPLKNKKKVIGIFAVQSYDNENAYDEADVKMLEIISDQISLSLERLKAEEDLKLAKEKAEESDRLKSAFLANMSHEIRTPMNGILGFTQLLKEPQLTGEELDQYIQVIERSGMRMLNTINDIIDISKIEAGQVEVVKSEVIVNKLLEEQYNFFQNEAQSKGLELIYKPLSPDNDLRMITDQQKLAEILTNLIKNAIKFTKVGSITFGYSIKTIKEKEFVEFYVKDTGIGIPANRIEAVFMRFEQADIEDTRAFEGSGLGLAISKSYVEMLGGEIGVNSKEGEGSTFTFYIPYIRQNLRQKGTVHNKKEELEISLKNLSVIVVEDDETSRIFSEIILKNQVKRVSFVTTGKEMIEKLRETPDTDIILMDIELPDMNGYGVIRKIRKLKNDVIIIAQTAFDLSGDKEKALEAGCDDYICKPIKKEILFKKILTLLDKKSI